MRFLKITAGRFFQSRFHPVQNQTLFPAGYNEWRKAIGCRVASPAVDGKANKAVIRLISTTIGVPASAVSIVSGLTSSQKKVRISGITKAQLAGLLCSGSAGK